MTGPGGMADAIDALLARAEQAAQQHPSCATQVAIARDGDLLAFETFGRAPVDGGAREVEATTATLFSIYSVTKAIVAAAAWIVLQEERLRLTDRVAVHVPEFGSHGKDGVTVEQLLTHTAGFPRAQLPVHDWPDPARRLRHFADWTLDWAPGSRFVYHPTSSMWVLAELIGRCTGIDYREFVRTRIAEPLGLADLHIGLPEAEHGRIADVIAIGETMSADERAISPVDAPVIDDATLAYANDARNRAIGGPGGGAIATAGDLARFYQALLADADGRGSGIWSSAMLSDAWTVRNAAFVDKMTGQPAMRGLGVVRAGHVGRIWRGFSDDCSTRAFGHMGAGGQISWADPASGLSFAFVTNGAHRNPVHQGAAGLQLSTLAAACGG